MKHNVPVRYLTAMGMALAVIIVGFGLHLSVAGAQGGLDPDADGVLRSMSKYLGGLKAFSVEGDASSDVIERNGQKLQFTSSGVMVAQRPDNLFATRKTTAAQGEMYFDGKTVTLYSKKQNAYFQTDSPGSIDKAIDAVRRLGLDVSAADLFYADPYPGLLTDVEQGRYVGTAIVNGIETHQLAFRARQVDWQIWIKTGDAPLPLRYVITTKWLAGAPQYSVQFYNWNTSPKVDGKRFVFVAPKDAKKLDRLPVNEIGELKLEVK